MRRLLALLFVIACRDAKPAPVAPPAPVPSRPADHARGAAAYAKFCAPCHADDATGYKADHAPSLINPTFLESARDGFLIDAITQGRPGTSMAAYGSSLGGPLDPTTITEITAWIRSLGGAPRELAHAPTGGDATRGQPIYETNCQKCHGNPQTRGDYVSLSNPRFLATASDAFMNHAILYGRPGTPMISWQTTLTAQNIADVIAYVRSLQQSVAAQRLPPPTGKEPLFINPTGKPPKLVGGELIVGEVRPGRRVPTPELRSHQIMLKVDDVAGIAKRAVALGAKLDSDPEDFPYGERQAMLTDPFGHQWTLTQTLVDTAPDAWGGELVTPRR